MKRSLQFAAVLGLAAAGIAPCVVAQDDERLDRLGAALSTNSPDGRFAAKLSGLVDLEAYSFDGARPGFIDTERDTLINPRLTVFADAQATPAWYAFAQLRVDRGFDPAADQGRVRLDEYAMRFTPEFADRHTSFQVGKFATVIGAWPARHDSWHDGFITPPLPYGGASTPLWSTVAVRAPATLFSWSYRDRPVTPADRAADPYRRVPLVWGPAYAEGAAVSWQDGAWETRVELKNAAPSAPPDTWRDGAGLRHDPTLAGRIGWRPDAAWRFGISAARGPYLRRAAMPTLPSGTTRGDFREELWGADASYAHGHWQAWAEVFSTRYAIPGVGEPRVTSGFIETRWRATPRFSAGLRWGRQEYSDLTTPGFPPRPWGLATTRVEFAPAFRFTPHVQLKLQFSRQREDDSMRARVSDTAAQLTVRF